jgi:hypothetical protein
VTECDGETSVMRTPWPTTGCCATGKINLPDTYTYIAYCKIEFKMVRHDKGFHSIRFSNDGLSV